MADMAKLGGEEAWAENADAAFIAFCKVYVQRHPINQ
jgi:hypothetical protein